MITNTTICYSLKRGGYHFTMPDGEVVYYDSANDPGNANQFARCLLAAHQVYGPASVTIAHSAAMELRGNTRH